MLAIHKLSAQHVVIAVKRLIQITLTAIGILSITQAFAAPAMKFKHPGALNNQAELDFVKQKIQQGAEPWVSQFESLKRYAVEGGKALTSINSSSEDANISKRDAQKTYANALAWAYTGDERYAKQAVAILNAWSGLQGFTAGSDQDKLQAGWIGALFAPAAEIMRTYPGWAKEDITNIQIMFKRAFYPQLNVASGWNGNVDLTQIDAIMNIAVFNEDENEFNLGLQRLKKRNPAYFYLAADGGVPPINGDHGNYKDFWSNPLRWVDGLTQETCRDNNHHAQYALASALHANEVAWHQGLDIYGENTARYTATLELMAVQMLTGNMQDICSNNIATQDIYATWEIGYNHYHNRKGITLPNTEKILRLKVRATGKSDWNIFYETLTHNLSQI